MKKINLIFIALLFTSVSFSQISYLQYRQVPQNDEAKFVERETKHWSKVAKAAIDKGQLSGWTLWRKIGVTTVDKPNYVFVNSYNPWADILSKSKMNDILPNGFEYRILYERVMTVE